MRLHITIEDDHGTRRGALARPDTGPARLTADDPRDSERRWRAIFDGIGCLSDEPHEWDEDPAAWVRAQRGGAVRAAG